jgi:hypothetical protein
MERMLPVVNSQSPDVRLALLGGQITILMRPQPVFSAQLASMQRLDTAVSALAVLVVASHQLLAVQR